MRTTEIQSLQGLIVEEDIPLTLENLCQACRASREHVVAWVQEGVLEPLGETPQDWRFTGVPCTARGWPCGSPAIWKSICVALALDLFNEIAELKAHQQRLGPR